MDMNWVIEIDGRSDGGETEVVQVSEQRLVDYRLTWKNSAKGGVLRVACESGLQDFRHEDALDRPGTDLPDAVKARARAKILKHRPAAKDGSEHRDGETLWRFRLHAGHFQQGYFSAVLNRWVEWLTIDPNLITNLPLRAAALAFSERNKPREWRGRLDEVFTTAVLDCLVQDPKRQVVLRLEPLLADENAVAPKPETAPKGAGA